MLFAVEYPMYHSFISCSGVTTSLVLVAKSLTTLFSVSFTSTLSVTYNAKVHKETYTSTLPRVHMNNHYCESQVLDLVVKQLEKNCIQYYKDSTRSLMLIVLYHNKEVCHLLDI